MRVDELKSLGVDERIINVLKRRGIEELYPPQADALKSGVLSGENLLLAIPTASGKTLVAEIVMLNKLFKEGGKAVYIVPLKALAEEKYREFKEWENFGVRVAMTTGDYDSGDEWLGSYDIIIATSEKFDSLLRHKSRWIMDVKLVVADEIHLLGSFDRGATLEMTLSHLLGKAQILGLSATVGNAEELAEWLNAKLVVSDWRPVQLKKGVFYNGEVIWEDESIQRFGETWDSLVIDAIKRGKQALVFVNTRRSAEREAIRLGKKVKRLLTKAEQRRLKTLVDELESNPTNEKVKEVLVNGVTFHHAGLGRKERTLIEDAFREGLIKVITATPTLSAGVNLPSFRVIVRDTKRYSSFGWTSIPVLEIQQMLGRAGRPKYDKEGEAIIVAKESEDPREVFKKYILGKPEKLFSMLSNESAFRSQVLALITNFGVKDFLELVRFLEKTFFYHQRKNVELLEEKAKKIVYFFFENGFIDIDLEDRFIPLPFGIRTSQLYIDPLTAKRFKDALPNLEENPNPLGVFQLLASSPDLNTLRAKRKEMDDLFDYAYEMEEHFYTEIPYYEDYEVQIFLGQVKTAKLLLDWINEVREEKILESYGIDSGDLYRVLDLADWLLYSLIEIYKLFEPKKEVLQFLQDLRLRVKHGVREELLELVKLPMVGRKRARALYLAGFKSIEDMANAKPAELLKVEGIGVGVLKEIYKALNLEMPKIKEKKAKKGTLDAFLK
ncbi:dynein regulation protein LC7 [Palaeococcus pacificus DY20341]|uniref:ATP-dependent DNA helicase Hel308 n=1 Tax=Palaeococcus pacificus DY20341 TaxID=1343739 RepID=A0A075LP46_9EURY|nr:ATP-dependent DNA helicase [Palaeococcus pacificus]AIF68475.1 dynein regulation protein LC7 [Palaeococcus pacificus DY20341]